MIVAISGFQGAGKDTVASYLIERHGFIKVSFAAVLKDVVAVLFGWPRDKLEGISPEDRAWREQVDPWWAEALDMPYLSPRYVLQFFGTNLFRNHFHPDIWVQAALRKIRDLLDQGQDNIVITDLRFINEALQLRRLSPSFTVPSLPPSPDVRIIHLFREMEIPAWYQNTSDKDKLAYLRLHNFHESDQEWPLVPADHIWLNHGSVEDLHALCESLISSQK